MAHPCSMCTHCNLKACSLNTVWPGVKFAPFTNGTSRSKGSRLACIESRRSCPRRAGHMHAVKALPEYNDQTGWAWALANQEILHSSRLVLRLLRATGWHAPGCREAIAARARVRSEVLAPFRWAHNVIRQLGRSFWTNINSCAARFCHL